MATIEILLTTLLLVVLIFSLYSILYYKTKYIKEKSINNKKLIFISRAVDLYSPESFNTWLLQSQFKTMFLRLDKLSLHLIEEYIKEYSNGILNHKDFEEHILIQFERKIIKNWKYKLG